MKLPIFVVLLSFSLYSQDLTTKFPRQSISSFIKSGESIFCDDLKKSGDKAFDTRMMGASGSVKYLGKVREISKVRQGFLKDFSVMKGVPLDKDYKKEIFVQDGKVKYWLPIQNQTLATFKDSAEKGDEIIVYIRKLGCLKTQKSNELMSILIFVETVL